MSSVTRIHALLLPASAVTGGEHQPWACQNTLLPFVLAYLFKSCAKVFIYPGGKPGACMASWPIWPLTGAMESGQEVDDNLSLPLLQQGFWSPSCVAYQLA